MRATSTKGWIRARRGAAVVAGLVLVGAAVGCAPDNPDQTGATGTSASAKPATVALLTAAATSTGDQHTARLTLDESMSASLLPAPITVKGAGAVDLDLKSAQLDVDLSGPSSDGGSGSTGGDLHEIVVGGKLYLSGSSVSSLIPAGKTWVEVDAPSQLSGSAANSFASAPQASSLLAMLQGISGGVSTVGTEAIGGVPTTHYRADLDLAKVAAKAPGGVPADVKPLVGELGEAAIPVDVWVGADGLVHQMVMKLTLGSLMGKALGLDMTLRMTLDHFGDPVVITAPPLAEVAPVPGPSATSH